MSYALRRAEQSLSELDLHLYERDYEHSRKTSLVAYLLLIFLGVAGGHKFYLGRIWWGLSYGLLQAIFWFSYVIGSLGLLSIFDLASDWEKVSEAMTPFLMIGGLAGAVLGIMLIVDLVTLPAQVAKRNENVRWALLSEFDSVKVPDYLVDEKSFFPQAVAAIVGAGLLCFGIVSALTRNKANAPAQAVPTSVSDTSDSTSKVSAEAVPVKRWSQYIGFTKASARLVAQDIMEYQFSDTVQITCQFQNVANKTLTGVKLKLRISDSFGVMDHEFVLQGQYSGVAPGGVTSTDKYWEYEDNPFTDQEPYDDVLSSVQSGTAKYQATITSLSYADGSTASFGEELWRSPAR